MKKLWEHKRLGDVIELEYGKPLPDSKRNAEGAYPVYGANGEKDRTDEYYHDKKSIIVGRKGSAGEINLTENKFWPLDVTYFVTFDDKKHDLKFLYYLLSNLELPILAKGVKPGINRNEVYSITVRIPSLPEQQRIASNLDDTFSAIVIAKENAERNLQNARNIFQSYLENVFDNHSDEWKQKRLGEVAQHSLGKMLDKAKNQGSYKKYLRNLNVRWFEFDLSDLLEMRFRDDEQEQYTAVRGDILICEGGYPGRAAIWNEEYPIHFQKAIHRVRFNLPEYNKWFIYFLYLSHLNRNIEKYFTGAGIQHFTGEALDRFIIPIAPISEVKKITLKLDNLFDEIKQLENIYQKKLANLVELKKSILHKAFSGELSGTN